MRSLTIAVLLAVLAVAPPAGAQGGDSVVVEVQNARAVAVTVYLRTGRFDRRLLEVPARETRLVTLPAWALTGRTGVALVVHPEGEADIGTRSYVVQSGGRITLEVPAAGALPVTPDDTMTAPLTPEELASTTLTVDNPRDRAVTVYVERGQYDVRLGVVPPRQRATLRLPKSVVGPDRSLRIFVHPEGGTDLASSLLRIRRGEHLGLRVPAF